MCSKKKVLAIQGSFKENGITTKMLKYAVKEAEKAGNDIEYINLHECNINYCKGVSSKAYSKIHKLISRI